MSTIRHIKKSIHSTCLSFLSIQVIFELKTETQQNINLFRKTHKQTIATFAISSVSSFTCASVRPASVTTDSICITAMRVGRALVHVYYKIHKDIYSLYVQVFFFFINSEHQHRDRTASFEWGAKEVCVKDFFRGGGQHACGFLFSFSKMTENAIITIKVLIFVSTYSPMLLSGLKIHHH